MVENIDSKKYPANNLMNSQHDNVLAHNHCSAGRVAITKENDRACRTRATDVDDVDQQLHSSNQ